MSLAVVASETRPPPGFVVRGLAATPVFSDLPRGIWLRSGGRCLRVLILQKMRGFPRSTHAFLVPLGHNKDATGSPKPVLNEPTGFPT